LHLVANNVVFYLEHPEQRESYTNVERHATVFFQKNQKNQKNQRLTTGVKTPWLTKRETPFGRFAPLFVSVTDPEGWAVGVVSQTDVVLARQGRSDPEMDKLTVADVMTPRLIGCRPHTRVSEAITKMTRMKVHRLVVVEEHGDKLKAVGLMSMRAIVRRMAGAPQPIHHGSPPTR
jgi:CBS-domain-containing membrane protein